MSKRSEAKIRNCVNCNKALKRSTWYYRNSGYFCNKSCFKKHLAKQEKAS